MNIATRKGRKGFTLVELLVVIAIIVALAALATPQIFKALKRAALAEALNNARQVKFALDGFAVDFDPVIGQRCERRSGVGSPLFAAFDTLIEVAFSPQDPHGD